MSEYRWCAYCPMEATHYYEDKDEYVCREHRAPDRTQLYPPPKGKRYESVLTDEAIDVDKVEEALAKQENEFDKFFRALGAPVEVNKVGDCDGCGCIQAGLSGLCHRCGKDHSATTEESKAEVVEPTPVSDWASLRVGDLISGDTRNHLPKGDTMRDKLKEEFDLDFNKAIEKYSGQAVKGTVLYALDPNKYDQICAIVRPEGTTDLVPIFWEEGGGWGEKYRPGNEDDTGQGVWRFPAPLALRLSSSSSSTEGEWVWATELPKVGEEFQFYYRLPESSYGPEGKHILTATVTGRPSPGYIDYKTIWADPSYGFDTTTRLTARVDSTSQIKVRAERDDGKAVPPQEEWVFATEELVEGQEFQLWWKDRAIPVHAYSGVVTGTSPRRVRITEVTRHVSGFMKVGQETDMDNRVSFEYYKVKKETTPPKAEWPETIVFAEGDGECERCAGDDEHFCCKECEDGSDICLSCMRCTHCHPPGKCTANTTGRHLIQEYD